MLHIFDILGNLILSLDKDQDSTLIAQFELESFDEIIIEG